MSVFFEWSHDKAQANKRKHGVSFDEAVTCFADSLSLTIRNPLHSEGEQRFLQLGLSSRQRLLVVAYAEEERQSGATIRVISARPASRAEVKQYEQGF